MQLPLLMSTSRVNQRSAKLVANWAAVRAARKATMRGARSQMAMVRQTKTSPTSSWTKTMLSDWCVRQAPAPSESCQIP